MTAITVIPQRQAIHFVSDGLGAGDGQYVLHNKVSALAHCNAIVGIRGTIGAAAYFVPLVGSRAQNFDELLAALPTVAREFVETNPHLCRPARADLREGLELLVAGYSKSSGLKAYYLTTHQDPVQPDLEPYALYGITDVVAAPGSHGAYDRIRELIGDVDACDVRAIGHDIVGIQRECINPLFSAPIVGGFSQLTTLSIASGKPVITTELLGTWPLPTTGEVAEPEIEYAA
jgi:hypothetical protein